MGCDWYICEGISVMLLGMSETKQWRFNGHREVQSEAAVAPHLRVQKQDFQNTKCSRAWHGRRCLCHQQLLKPRRSLRHSMIPSVLGVFGKLSVGGAKVLSKVGKFSYSSGGRASNNKLHQVLKGGPQTSSSSSTSDLIRNPKFLSSEPDVLNQKVRCRSPAICFNTPPGDSDAH